MSRAYTITYGNVAGPAPFSYNTTEGRFTLPVPSSYNVTDGNLAMLEPPSYEDTDGIALMVVPSANTVAGGNIALQASSTYRVADEMTAVSPTSPFYNPTDGNIGRLTRRSVSCRRNRTLRKEGRERRTRYLMRNKRFTS